MMTNILKTATAHSSHVVLALFAAALLSGCRMDDAALDDGYSPASYQERHPIRVTDAPVKMNISARAGTLGPQQMNSVIAFANDARGNASSVIAVRWSSGSANARNVAQETITVLTSQGIPQAMIRTGGASGSSSVVSLSFMRKVAVTNECGDWSENLTGDQNNDSYKNFGCASQNNLAEMVANPEDFETARTMAPATAASRSKATGDYNKGVK